MPVPKLNKPEGLAALINASIHMSSKGMYTQDSFNWTEILREFQEYHAVRFAEWFAVNYSLVHSERLDKKAWVNCNEHVIYIHGSDLHYTQLIENYGKKIEEIWQIYLKESRDEPSDLRETNIQVPYEDSEPV